MGNLCSSPNIMSKNEGLNRPSTAKVIHINGSLQEFRVSIKANHILSRHPDSFLCSSESMYIGSSPPHLPKDQELQLGHIYFLIPTSKSHVPLSLQDLCSLAIKASTALQTRSLKLVPVTGSGYSVAKSKHSRNPLDGFEMVGKNSLVAHGSTRIEIYDWSLKMVHIPTFLGLKSLKIYSNVAYRQNDSRLVLNQISRAFPTKCSINVQIFLKLMGDLLNVWIDDQILKRLNFLCSLN